MSLTVSTPLRLPISPPFGYQSSLFGQYPVARVVYQDADAHINELWNDGGLWRRADLTAISGGPGTNEAPFGFQTYFPGELETARVIYTGPDQHIYELSTTGDGWQHADLTERFGGPPGVSVFCYQTFLVGQGTVARILYLGPDFHVHELWTNGGPWHPADLTAQAGAPTAFEIAVGYQTTLAGQSQPYVARVIYRGGDNGLHELWTDGSKPWQHAELTAQAGAPLVASFVHGYQTNLAGQGTVARVVYLDSAHEVHELWTDGRRPWQHTPLTQLLGGPRANTPPFGFETSFPGQGPVARVIYATGGDIREISTSGGPWQDQSLDGFLIVKEGTFGAQWPLSAYTTFLHGQGVVARLVFLEDRDGLVHELWSNGGPWQHVDLSKLAG